MSNKMEKEEIKFALSPENLKNIPFDKYEQDFTFIVNGKEYKTSRIVADILSPKIRNAHLTDSTINNFYINTNDQKNDNDNFSNFLKLVNYSTNSIETNLINEYSEYFYRLGNNHEYVRLQLINLNPITKENSISNIFKEEEKNEFSITYEDDELKKFILFISSHFYEIDKEKMKELPKSAIYSILSSPDLQISDEDSFLNFAIEMYLTDRSYSDLFEYVLFNNVSENSIASFISTFSIDDLNVNIWKSICTRFFVVNDSFYNERYHKNKLENIKVFEVTKDHELSGILRYLNKNKKGNIHDNGTINITSNSICSDDLDPKNLADDDEYNDYQSNDEENIFIKFDFKDKRIQLKSYSIKSNDGGENDANLRNWVVEVSNDDQIWIEIDSHSDDSSLNSESTTCNFNVKKEINEFYRYVRLRQTGYSWYLYPDSESYILRIPFLEFFGKLKEYDMTKT